MYMSCVLLLHKRVTSIFALNVGIFSFGFSFRFDRVIDFFPKVIVNFIQVSSYVVEVIVNFIQVIVSSVWVVGLLSMGFLVTLVGILNLRSRILLCLFCPL